MNKLLLFLMVFGSILVYAGESFVVEQSCCIEYMPPLVRGDNNWDEGFMCNVKAEIRLENNKIIARVYMKGEEGEEDWTTVEGWSPWKTVYTPPAGWQIAAISRQGEGVGAVWFNENQSFAEIKDCGPVAKFYIFGFQGNNPNTAGNYSKVQVSFHTVKILIEKR